MPRYEALDAGMPLKASRSDLVDFQWRIDDISADFRIPDDEAHSLRVSFDRPCIVRLLDEMALSTEEDDTPNEGLISEHFACRLHGARFEHHQSWAWKEVSGPIAHYQFVTGDTCFDVLSGGAPTFSVVDRTDRLSFPADPKP